MDDRASDTITICERYFTDLRTTSADLHCLCSTRRLMTTPPAVRTVQEALIGAGFSEGCLTVKSLSRSSELGGCLGVIGGVAIIVAAIVAYFHLGNLRTTLPVIAAAVVCLGVVAWILFRSTECAFAVTCADAAAVERALGLIAKVGGVSVTSTVWRHEIDHCILGDWAVACIERANVRADRVAEALGVRVVGVASYEESFDLPDRHYSPDPMTPPPAAVIARRSRVGFHSGSRGGGPSSMPTVLAGAERGGASVTVRYRVADYTPRHRQRDADEATS
jgi:hypothetical protein